MTLATQLVLTTLLREPRREHYGLEIVHSTGLRSGTVFPILARLEKAGWVRSRWERVATRQANRARRHYYRMTGHGVTAARCALPPRRPQMLPTDVAS